MTCLAPERTRVRPLTVGPSLKSYVSAMKQERQVASDESVAMLNRVIALTQSEFGVQDSVSGFEAILNGSLDLGYRGKPLCAFVYGVLKGRFAARVRRRLAVSGQSAERDEVDDLVGTTAEAVQIMIGRANRERHSLTYALLLSIADHRTIDHLRRKKPEYRETMDDQPTSAVPLNQEISPFSGNPEVRYWAIQRINLARRLRGKILEATNLLEADERRALIMVEVLGHGYDAIANALNIKRTDVGNIVRRARLRRDRNLMPLLRQLTEVEGNLGFADLQSKRELRLNLLRWATEMGDGVCGSCLEHGHLLHTGERGCFVHSTALSPEMLEEAVQDAI